MCSAEQICPPKPLGLKAERIDKKQIIYAVASEELIGKDELSKDLAISTAEMKAKALLTTNGADMIMLSGLVQEFTCVKDETAYVGLKLDPDSVKQASALQRMIAESLKNNPTPGSK
jgi:hypothetical protein